MTTRKPNTSRATTLLLAASALALAFAVLGARPAAASPVSTATSTNTCWKDVVNDWLQHQPNIVGTYPIPCYTQAIQHLSQYPDVQNYSSASDDIHRALLAAIREDRGGGGPGGGIQPPSSGGSNSSTGGRSRFPDATGATNSKKGVLPSLFDRVAPGNAQSIPLPLLVLGGLALLLLLTAGGTWIARRIQARRMTPEPHRAP